MENAGSAPASSATVTSCSGIRLQLFWKGKRQPEAGDSGASGKSLHGIQIQRLAVPSRTRPPNLLTEASFREGLAAVKRLGLSFDAYMYHTQLLELVDLASSFLDTPIILNHTGGAIGIGPYAGKRDDVFKDWRSGIVALARCPNVHMKLGGLGMRVFGFDFGARALPPSSEELAKAWAPYIETCIEAFGAERCMFESNFPVDKGTCSYLVLWNAFKRIVLNASEQEKRALLSETAARVYRLTN